MSIVEWLDGYLEGRKRESKIKLRRIIYNLNGGSGAEFYGCNGEDCPQEYKGMGLHFILTTREGKDPANDLGGFEDNEVDDAILADEEMQKKYIILCRWCYIKHGE